MYTVDELDEVIALTELPRSDAGAPMPLVLADEVTAVVAYGVPDADLPAIEPLIDGAAEDGEIMAVVRFVGCHAHMLGPPNDEAFEGHPLAGRGLRPYGAFSRAELLVAPRSGAHECCSRAPQPGALP